MDNPNGEAIEMDDLDDREESNEESPPDERSPMLERNESSVSDDPLCCCIYAKREHITTNTETNSTPSDSNSNDQVWDFEEHIKLFDTDAHGEISFDRYSTHAKYVRCAEDTEPRVIWELLTAYWGLDPPNLLISIAGSEMTNVEQKLRFAFQEALVETAFATKAWIFTDGMNGGASKLVGEAVRKFRRNGYQIALIGIASWGWVRNKEQLIGGNGNPVHYSFDHTSVEDSAPLDCNHTHFLLVDNGTQNQVNVEVTFRDELETYISAIDKYTLNTKIDILCDNLDQIKAKIRNARCEEGQLENNPLLEFAKHVLFQHPRFGSLRIETEPQEEYCESYEDLEKIISKYKDDQEIFYKTLKKAIVNELDQINLGVNLNGEIDVLKDEVPQLKDKVNRITCVDELLSFVEHTVFPRLGEQGFIIDTNERNRLYIGSYEELKEKIKNKTVLADDLEQAVVKVLDRLPPKGITFYIPAVQILVAGEPGTLKTAKKAVENSKPIIVVKGTGGAADLLTYACTTEYDVDSVNFELQLQRKLAMSGWLPDDHLQSLAYCANQREGFTIYNQQSSGSLNMAIAQAVKSVKKVKTKVMLELQGDLDAIGDGILGEKIVEKSKVTRNRITNFSKDQVKKTKVMFELQGDLDAIGDGILGEKIAEKSKVTRNRITNFSKDQVEPARYTVSYNVDTGDKSETSVDDAVNNMKIFMVDGGKFKIHGNDLSTTSLKVDQKEDKDLVQKMALIWSKVDLDSEDLFTGNDQSQLTRLVFFVRKQEKPNRVDRICNGDNRDANKIIRIVMGDTDTDLAKDNPEFILFIWSLLMLKVDLASLFFGNCQNPVATSLIAVTILNDMVKHVEDSEEKATIQELVKHYKDASVGVLNTCYSVNKENTHLMLINSLSKMGTTNTCIELSVSAKHKEFISQPGCQTLFDNAWNGEKTQEFIKKGKESKCSTCCKCGKCSTLNRMEWPIYKFYVNYLFYFSFLILYSIILLTRFDPWPNVDPWEYLLMVWMIALFYEDIGQVVTLKWSRINHDLWNVLDVFTLCLYFLGFILRLIPQSKCSRCFAFTVIILAIDLLLFIFRMLHVFTMYREENRRMYKHLGPKLVMIGRMLFNISFLILYSIILSTRFNPEVNVKKCECILMILMLALFCEKIRPVVTFQWSLWNVLDAATIFLYLLGFVLRHIPQGTCSRCFECAVIILAIDLMLFVLRTLHGFTMYKPLGPKLVMIRRMMKDLFYFLAILMVFVTAYGLTQQAIMCQEKLGLNLFIDVFYKAYWQIFGRLFPDDLDDYPYVYDAIGNKNYTDPIYDDNSTDAVRGVCPLRNLDSITIKDLFLQVLLAAYFLITYLLMLNLLIAMFSYTFTKIQEKSDQTWKYQRYFLLRKFITKHPLPPPINLIYSIYMMFEGSAKSCGCCSRKSDSRESHKDKDRILKKWEKINAENYLRNQLSKKKLEIDERIKETSDRVYNLEQQMGELREMHTQIGQTNQEQIKIVLPTQFTDYTVEKVENNSVKEFRAPEEIRLGINPGSMNPLTDDAIIVCAQLKPQFTVVKIFGTNPLQHIYKTYRLPEGNYIRSGVLIREQHCNGKTHAFYMFIVGYVGEYRVCTVVLKSGTPILKARFEIRYEPIHAFYIDKLKFGVLSAGKYTNIISVYSKNDLENPPDIYIENLHHNTLWSGRGRIIDLPGSDRGVNNTISVTSDGHFCLGVYQEGNILIYNAGGICLTTLKISDGMSEPHSLICTGQNNILVVGKEGHVNLYQPNWERITEDKGRGEWVEVRGALVDKKKKITLMTCHSVVSGNYMWSADVVIKDYATKQEEKCMCLRAYTIQRAGKESESEGTI